MPPCVHSAPTDLELSVSRYLRAESLGTSAKWVLTQEHRRSCRPAKYSPMSTEEQLVRKICDEIYPGGFVMLTELEDEIEARVQFWEQGRPNEAVAFAKTRKAALNSLITGKNVEKYLADPEHTDDWDY